MLTRRSLLHRLLLVLGFEPVIPTRRTARPGGEAAQSARADPESPPSPLSRSELNDLVAFGEIVVNGGPLSPLDLGYLRDHIAYRVSRTPDYARSFYRTTVGLLTRLGGASFSTLDIGQRNALVTRHRLAVSRISPDENLGPFPEHARDVRTRVVPDLIGGYYSSEAGWAVVGYSVFPGRCGDLARYTGPDATSP